jgi:hypothetical protein
MVSVFVMFPPNPPACPGAKTNEMSFTRASCLMPHASCLVPISTLTRMPAAGAKSDKNSCQQPIAKNHFRLPPSVFRLFSPQPHTAPRRKTE